MLKLVLILLIAGMAAGQQCANDFKTFMGCVGQKAKEKMDKIDEKFGDEVKSQVSDCFTKSSCTKPDFEADIMADLPIQTKAILQGAKSTWNNAPDGVKMCMKKKMMVKIEAKINECLKTKGVDPIQLPENADQIPGMAGLMEEEEKPILKKIFQFKVNIAKGMRGCEEAKSGEAVKLTECMMNMPLKKTMRDAACGTVKNCSQSGVSTTCQDRFKSVKSALCQCHEEHMEMIKKKLEELRQQQSVELTAVMEVMGEKKDGAPEMIQSISKCYEENNAQPPPALRMIMMATSRNNGGSGGGPFGGMFRAQMPKLDSKTLDTLRDIMAAKAMYKPDFCNACDGDKP